MFAEYVLPMYWLRIFTYYYCMNLDSLDEVVFVLIPNLVANSLFDLAVTPLEIS